MARNLLAEDTSRLSYAGDEVLDDVKGLDYMDVWSARQNRGRRGIFEPLGLRSDG
jgi:hypothetical protein